MFQEIRFSSSRSPFPIAFTVSIHFLPDESRILRREPRLPVCLMSSSFPCLSLFLSDQEEGFPSIHPLVRNFAFTIILM